ncbi:MAG: ATP-binding protein [Deltaproteobacteria bacterium]|nr:ATP-binding protein [Deltaproteobacteria bacterium]
MEKHHLIEHLKKLKLPGMMNNFEMRLKEAQDNKLGYREFFSLLVQDEVTNREANRFQMRIKAACFKEEKVFEDYNFKFNEEALPSTLIRDLATCHFVEQSRNLILAGPPGIGNYVK